MIAEEKINKNIGINQNRELYLLKNSIFSWRYFEASWL